MIKVEGPVNVTVIEAYSGNPKFPFDPDKDSTNNRGEQIAVWGDVILLCEAEDGQRDYWHGEISNRDGIGNYSDSTRTELTIKTLQEIGFGIAGWNELWEQMIDDGSFPNMVGLKCTAVVEAREYNGKTYYQIKYLNALGGSSIKRMSKADFANSFNAGGFRKEAEQGQAAQTQAQQPAQTQPQTTPPAPNATGAPPQAGQTTPPAPGGNAPRNPYAG